MAVTPRAIEGKSGMAMQTEFRHAARGAPAPRVAHLYQNVGGSRITNKISGGEL